MSDNYKPGPWVYERRDVGNDLDVFDILELYEDDPPIATVGPHGTEADARLIAAAPDLLKALKESFAMLYETEPLTEHASFFPLSLRPGCVDSCLRCSMERVMLQSRIAIAKAEGGGR